MVKVDFAEHQATAELYGVKALPAFLMFQGGRLAWAGTLGGSPVKSAPPDTAAAGQRVLLVEPCAKVREKGWQESAKGREFCARTMSEAGPRMYIWPTCGGWDDTERQVLRRQKPFQITDETCVIERRRCRGERVS